jgi:S-adenosylmethionine hydrolase
MAPPPVITLTTDFGSTGTWVAQMKGAILGLVPEARIVDLTHEVPAHDVEAGAYLLETGIDAFPRGTIHVGVVDPGVGTDRAPVVIRTESYLLVGPDNGLFSRVLRNAPPRGAWRLDAAHYRAARPSATFEGRDVFAPAAAWLARGTDPSHFGEAWKELATVAGPASPPSPPAPFRTRVVHVDRFGNAVLDVTVASLHAWIDPATGLPALRAVTGSGAAVDAVRKTFGLGPSGVPFLLENSSGYLEIALREESAAEGLGLKRGDAVELHPLR